MVNCISESFDAILRNDSIAEESTPPILVIKLLRQVVHFPMPLLVKIHIIYFMSRVLKTGEYILHSKTVLSFRIVCLQRLRHSV